MAFDWDPKKDRDNLEKHGISFTDAIRVFDAEDECLELFDTAHSDLEERFITIGPTLDKIVLVVWTERDGGAIRVISARFATPRERRLYHRRMEDS
jgi:uncharacterized protein